MTEPTDDRDAGERRRARQTTDRRRRPGGRRLTRAPAAGRGRERESAVPPRPGRHHRSEHAPERQARACGQGRPMRRKGLTAGLFRGLKVLMWSALISVVVVGLGPAAVLHLAGHVSPRHRGDRGWTRCTEGGRRTAAADQPGTPLLQVDTDAVAERVAAIRRVASATGAASVPSTLRITVTERVPVVVKDYPDGPHLFDSGRRGFRCDARRPPAAVPGRRQPGARAMRRPRPRSRVATCTTARRSPGQVGRIAAPSVAADHARP